MSEQLNKALDTESVIWKLADLYNGLTDPKIEQDINFCREEAKSLHDEFSGKVHSLNAAKLLQLVSRLEKLYARRGKLSTFGFLNFTTQTQAPEAGAFLQKIREEGSVISKLTVFFELEWSTVDVEVVNKVLADQTLDQYRHYLSSMLRYAPHLLDRPEETLLIEIAPVGRGAWNLLFEKVMGNLKFGEAQRTEEEVLADLYHENRETRKQAALEMTCGLNSQLHILNHLTNTLLADKMIDDRLRHYQAWDSSMHLYNELTGSTVDVLVKAVTDCYDIPTRYYKQKKDILGVDELFDYDRYAPLPDLPDKQVPWSECRQMVIQSFADFSPEMAEIADLFFERQWIHAPILTGKRGGAFAHPCTPDIHPYVMVNYTGNIRDVSTVAHELGHGVHQYLAADLGYLNSDTPLVVAETASVFAELLLFNHQLKILNSKEEKNAFIAQKLESIFATVFRQIAMNRFEDLSHNGRRELGELSNDDLSKYWLTTQRAMFGDSVTLTRDYAIWWSYIPHFLNTPGYVYSYAFGELLVLALYDLYQQQGNAFVPKYIDLLRAGGSKSPYELVKPFGVDLNDPQFWQGGLKVINKMLTSIE